MIEFDMTSDQQELHRRWEDSQHCTNKVLHGDLKAVEAELPASVRILLKWLQTTRMVHHIALLDQGHDDHIHPHDVKKKKSKKKAHAPAAAPAAAPAVAHH